MTKKKNHRGRHGRGGKQNHEEQAGNRTGAGGDLGADLVHFRLLAQPEFYEAVSGQESPAARACNAESSQAPGVTMTLDNWSLAGDLLDWFKIGAAKDSSARLVFPPSLSQLVRSMLHRATAEKGLDSFSQGVGEKRHITICAAGKAVAKAPLGIEEKAKADFLYEMVRQAKNDSLRVSRDEIAEMVSQGTLTADLQSLWDKEYPVQQAIAKLNQAASRGHLDILKDAIQEYPDLVRSGKGNFRSNMTPLNCAAAQGHTDCLRALVAAGAPLEKPDGFGMTPLKIARKFEQMDTEAELLRSGAKDDDKQQDFSQEITVPDSPKAAPPPTALTGPSDSKAASVLEKAVNAAPFVPSLVKESENAEMALQVPEKESEGAKPGVSTTSASSAFENAPGPSIRSPAKNGQQDTNGEGVDRQQHPGGYVEASQPPVVAGKISKKLPAVVGGRSLSGGVPDGLLKDLSGSPNLRGDPRTATRGKPGASAVALGRRIIENAAVEMRRHGSAGLSGNLDKFPYLEPSQPPAVTSGKLRGVPNVVGGRGVSNTQEADPKILLSKNRPAKTARPGDSKRENKQRIDAWMESNSEEHSQASPSPPQPSSKNGYEPSREARQASGSQECEPANTESDRRDSQTNRSPEQAAVEGHTGGRTDGQQAEQATPANDKEEKPELKYQDPRAPANASAPPVASSVTRGAMSGSNSRPAPQDAPSTSTTTEDDSKQGRNNETTDSPTRARPPYTEGSQPPEVARQGFHQVPVVVGGQGIAGGKDPKTPTHGHRGPSATNLGKQVIQNPALQMERHGSAGRSGDLDAFPYVEPSQPPRGPSGKLTGIPNVVGGHGVAKSTAVDKGKEASTSGQLSIGGAATERLPTKNAALESPSTVEGEAISAVKPTIQEDALATAQEDMGNMLIGSRAEPAMGRISEEPAREEGERPLSFEFPRSTRKEAEEKIDNLLSNSSTAMMFGRPKGLGAAQGLPQKPAKSSPRGKPESPPRPLTTNSPKAQCGPSADDEPAGILAAIKEGLSVATNKLCALGGAGTGRAAAAGEPGSPSWLTSCREWLQENQGVVWGSAVAAAAGVFGLYLVRPRN